MPVRLAGGNPPCGACKDIPVLSLQIIIIYFLSWRNKFLYFISTALDDCFLEYLTSARTVVKLVPNLWTLISIFKHRPFNVSDRPTDPLTLLYSFPRVYFEHALDLGPCSLKKTLIILIEHCLNSHIDFFLNINTLSDKVRQLA